MAARTKTPTFDCAACKELENHEVVGTSLQRGRQALTAAHRDLVTGDADCGFAFDEAFKPKYRTKHRVDYLFVRKADCKVVAVEVHGATSTGTIEDLTKKRQATLEILQQEGIRSAVAAWHWVLPRGSIIAFPKNDPRALKAATFGIRFPKRQVDITHE